MGSSEVDKKEKKKKRKEKEAAAAAAGGGGDDEERREKKKKKRKSDEGGAPPAADDDAPSEKKKKKKEKGKFKGDAAAENTAAALTGRGGGFSYDEHPDVAAMSAKDVQAERDKRQMTVVMGGRECKITTQFKHCSFSKPIEKFLLSKYSAPSPIQSQSWPIILSNRDLIGIAATGSGKTLAFGAPGLMLCSRTKQVAKTPCMAVLAPTRELALQIGDVLNEAGKCVSVETAVVFGGMPKGEQIKALKTAHIVVATPGRLMDLMQSELCDLSRVKYLVLDEADRMLDQGFEKEVRAIIGATPDCKTRQSVMFSATWPKDAATLAADFLQEPCKIIIGSLELSASHTVEQRVEVCEMADRDNKLDALLNKYHNKKNRVLIFVLYKKEAPRVEQALKRKGHKAVAIHGDMTQEARLQALAGFKNGSTPMMIATDVAARGLDIPDVEYVINYSFPLTVEDYVHRIGRTGRAGKSGVAHTFFTVADKARAGELVNVLNEAKAVVPPELLKFGTHVKKKESKLYGAHFKDIDENAKATKITFGDDSDSD